MPSSAENMDFYAQIARKSAYTLFLGSDEDKRALEMKRCLPPKRDCIIKVKRKTGNRRIISAY